MLAFTIGGRVLRPGLGVSGVVRALARPCHAPQRRRHATRSHALLPILVLVLAVGCSGTPDVTDTHDVAPTSSKSALPPPVTVPIELEPSTGTELSWAGPAGIDALAGRTTNMRTLDTRIPWSELADRFGWAPEQVPDRLLASGPVDVDGDDDADIVLQAWREPSGAPGFERVVIIESSARGSTRAAKLLLDRSFSAREDKWTPPTWLARGAADLDGDRAQELVLEVHEAVPAVDLLDRELRIFDRRPDGSYAEEETHDMGDPSAEGRHDVLVAVTREATKGAPDRPPAHMLIARHTRADGVVVDTRLLTARLQNGRWEEAVPGRHFVFAARTRSGGAEARADEIASATGVDAHVVVDPETQAAVVVFGPTSNPDALIARIAEQHPKARVIPGARLTPLFAGLEPTDEAQPSESWGGSSIHVLESDETEAPDTNRDRKGQHGAFEPNRRSHSSEP